MPLWTVLYQDALTDWETRRRPAGEQLVAVLEWLLDMVDTGPPAEHLPVPFEEDLYVSPVGDTGLFATYLALAYERRVVIRRID